MTIVRIGIEIVLAIIILMAGNTFWEFPKRAKFLRRVISSENLLLPVLTPDLFDRPSPQIAPYGQKNAWRIPAEHIGCNEQAWSLQPLYNVVRIVA